MSPVTVSCVVEGHGETQAVPVLLRRMARTIDPSLNIIVPKPIRIPRGSLIHKEGELERAVALAALKSRPRGGVIVLLDSDDDCPAELASSLLDRARPCAAGLPVSVVLPTREFEAWFLAAAESIRGKRGLPPDLESPENPEGIRGAKGWLSARMPFGQPYSETVDQPALAAVFDLDTARSARSFDKLHRELRRLIERRQE